jgi:hypothetical protein
MYNIFEHSNAVLLMSQSDCQLLFSSWSFKEKIDEFYRVVLTAEHRLAASVSLDGTFFRLDEVFENLDTTIFLKFILSLNPDSPSMFETGKNNLNISSIPDIFQTKPVPSLPAYLFPALVQHNPPMVIAPGVTIMLIPPNHHRDNHDRPFTKTVVTALITSDRHAINLSEVEGTTMRTLMTTTVLDDGTHSIFFDPPVCAWLPSDSDVVLRLWLTGTLYETPVDIMGIIPSIRSPPRLCKMSYHDKRTTRSSELGEGIITKLYFVNREPSFFCAVRHIHVSPPSAPVPRYPDEGAALFNIRAAIDTHTFRIRQPRAASVIKAVWRRVLSSPYSAIGRKRLMKEFEVLSTELV